MQRAYQFLFVIVLTLQLVSSDVDAAGHNLQGFVGGSVRIRCGLDPFGRYNGLYIHKKGSEGQEIFINGYYDRPVTVLPEYLHRTFFNKTDLSMEITNLTLSDEGDYFCIFICNGANCKETKFYLTVTDVDAAGHNLQGFVGGSVRIRCGLDPFSGYNGLYIHKKGSEGQEIFINGYYDRPLTVLPEYIHRTFFNKTDLSMEITNLTLSDEGDYFCTFICNGAHCKETKFHLTVTANYSVPIITVQGCSNDPAQPCVVGCSSSGGHPPSSVTWGVIGNKTSYLITDKEEPVIKQDVNSSLWNVSQTVMLNCSHPLDITCSVGGVMSRAVSVCTFLNYFCLNTEK